MRKAKQMAKSQLEDALHALVVDMGDVFAQVPEESVDFDSRSDWQKRGRLFPSDVVCCGECHLHGRSY